MNYNDAFKHEDQKQLYDLMKAQARKGIEDAYIGYKKVTGLNVSEETKTQFFERFIGMKYMYQDLFPGEYVTENNDKLEYTSCIVTLPEAPNDVYINTMVTLGFLPKEQVDTVLDDLISNLKEALREEGKL